MLLLSWKPTVFENRVLRRIFRLRRDEAKERVEKTA
jgi:uncharacterized protein (UPF0335 family)